MGVVEDAGAGGDVGTLREEGDVAAVSGDWVGGTTASGGGGRRTGSLAEVVGTLSGESAGLCVAGVSSEGGSDLVVPLSPVVHADSTALAARTISSVNRIVFLTTKILEPG